jgi:hypothetical protein
MVLNLSIFVRQKSLYSKKEPKSASRRLNKLKKRVLKSFLDEILNYRSAGPLSVPIPATGTKRKILAGPKKNYRDRDQIKRVTGTWTGTKKVGPAHLYSTLLSVCVSQNILYLRNNVCEIF